MTAVPGAPGVVNHSALWDEFVAGRKNGTESTLLDFSYAGYHHGETGIPAPDLKIFNVADFGAVPDDGKDDQDAVQRTIDAASVNGGGIVFFPPGVFQFFTDIDKRVAMTIPTGHIVLRGSGATRGGTVLFQYHHGIVLSPGKEKDGFTTTTGVVPLLTFKGAAPEGPRKVLTAITADAPRNALVLEVADGRALRPGQYVTVSVGDGIPAAKEMLAPYEPPKEWSRLIRSGVKWNEIHQIKSVDGNRVTLAEPLKIAAKVAYLSFLGTFAPVEEIGVEDICFMGNFLGNFIHHRSGLEDYGWAAVDGIKNAANVWVRRVSAINVNQVFNIDTVFSSSFLMIRSAGATGHESFIQSRCSHNLIGLYQDESEGVLHNFTIRATSAGTVAWRIKMHPICHCDFHGMQPYATLLDSIDGGYLTGSGGPVESFPHHARDLTIWNFNYLSGGNQPNRKFLMDPLEFWAGPFMVMPILSGMHGLVPPAKPATMTANESFGTPVEPESLYEAQLALRLGKLPDWIPEVRAAWETWRREPLPEFFNPLRADNKALFNVMVDTSAKRLAREISFTRFLRMKEANFTHRFSGPELVLRTDFEKAFQLVFNLMAYLTSYSTKGGQIDVATRDGKIVVTITGQLPEPAGNYAAFKSGKVGSDRYIGEEHWRDLDAADRIAAAIHATFKRETRGGVGVIEVTIPPL